MARKSERRQKILNVYADAFFNSISGGEYLVGENIASYGLKPVASRLLARGKMSGVISVVKFPYEFNLELIEYLRILVKQKHPTCTVNFNLTAEAVELNIEDERFHRMVQGATEKFTNINAAFNELTPEQQAMGVSAMNGTRRITFGAEDVKKGKNEFESYRVTKEKLANNEGLFYCYMFIHIVGPTNKQVSSAIKTITGFMKGKGFKFREVKSMIDKYLEYFSPTRHISPSSKGYGQVYFTDDNMIHVLPTKEEGLVHDSGALMGINMKNASPVFAEFFSSGSGQTMLVDGQTGSGKTLTMFVTAPTLAGQGAHIGVIDMKKEWHLCGQLMGYKEISMSGSTAGSINTLRLDDIPDHILTGQTGFASDELYAHSLNGTVALLGVMAAIDSDGNRGALIDLDDLLRKAVESLYQSYGVNPQNYKTFKNTATLTYADIIPHLREVSELDSLSDHKRMIALTAAERCEAYILTNTDFVKSLKNEVTIGDVLQAPLVIFSMDRKDQTTIGYMDAIRVCMAQFMLTKKNMFRKAEKKHSVLISEEVQLYDEVPELLRFLTQSVTIARSQNVMNILVMNAISALEGTGFKAIMSNISSAMIGKINPDDLEFLRKHTEFEELFMHLEDMQRDRDTYQYCFACHFSTGVQDTDVILKTYVPPELLRKLETRDKMTRRT